jgi:hypothetical protein
LTYTDGTLVGLVVHFRDLTEAREAARSHPNAIAHGRAQALPPECSPGAYRLWKRSHRRSPSLTERLAAH